MMYLKSQVRVGCRAEYFVVLLAICYYWAYLYFRVILPLPEESIFAYSITVAPIAVFSLLGIFLHIVARGWRISIKDGFAWLMVFGVLSAVVSVARGDVSTILSAGLLTISLLWLSKAPTVVSALLLNRLFLVSIIMGGIFHALDLSAYGVFPGQYFDGEDRGIVWRVSLFPYVPESGFFAALVLVVNQINGVGRSRYIYCFLALYFLIFSGVRSALIGWLLVLVFLFLDRNRHGLDPRKRLYKRLLLILVFVIVFVFTIAGSGLLIYVPNLSGTAVGSYLLREASGDITDESISKSVYRSWLWLQHIDIFMSNPFFGVGTYELKSIVGEGLLENVEETGTESFLTLWLSRLGLMVLPLVAFLVLFVNKSAASLDQLPMAWCVILLIAMLAYGSFIVPYNFLFIVIFSSILSSRAISMRYKL